MATRCTVHFVSGKTTGAIVYRHWDGYPDAMLPDLERFFEDVKKHTKDTRFDDPCYLAAKFIVWQANEGRKTNLKYANDTVPKGGIRPEDAFLDFLSVGPVMEDPGDIEYRYILHCDKPKPPKITYERA